MSGDEPAATQYLASANMADPGWEPRAAFHFSSASELGSVGNNVFTPISVTERLRNLPRRDKGSRTATTLPPMRPGQMYGLPPREEQSPPIDLPEREPMIAAQRAGQTAEDPAYFEELRQYQQSYWAHLQSTNSSPAYVADAIEKHEPTYLHGVDDPLSNATAEILSLPPIENEYKGFSHGENPAFFHTPDHGEGTYEPWRLDEPMADFDLMEYGGSSRDQSYGGEPTAWMKESIPQPVGAADQENYPASQPEAIVQTQDWTWHRRIMHNLGKVLANQHPAELSSRRLVKVAAYGILVLLLAFFTIQVGQIVLSLLRNEQEFKAVQEEYYAANGVELERRASRVELLPSGVTFPPTTTPQPMVTPSPTPIIAIRGGSQPNLEDRQDVLIIEGQESAITAKPRTKATRYEDNSLTNILDPYVERRKENPDIVGHLTVEGLMDETVMMRNNTYYLTHDAYGSFSEMGMVFVDEGCSLKNPPENLHLRGQSKVDGKVFAPLWMYRSGGIDFVRQHALVRVDTMYEEALYVVFAVIETTGVTRLAGDFNYGGYPSFLTDVQMENHVEAARRNSLYEIPVDVLPSDRMLTLSTISDGLEDRVLVLVARKLRPGETAASFSPSLASARLKGVE